MPDEATKTGMRSRKAELEKAMKTANEFEVRVEVAKLFTVLAARSGGEDEIRGVQMVYVEDLYDVPAFALIAACSDLRRGLSGEAKWVPSPGTIRQRAMKIVEPYRDELADLTAILLAVPEERQRLGDTTSLSAAERVRQMLKKAERESNAFPPARHPRDLRSEPERQRSADDRLTEMRYSDRPLGISDELRGQLVNKVSIGAEL